MNQILSYRGLLATDGQDTILLSTKKGEKGFRIIKFELMGQQPGIAAMEHIVKVYKTEQSTIDGNIDFSDNRLLAAAYMQDNIGEHYVSSLDVVFDQEIFNQDIFVTAKDVKAGLPINYYLELEVIMLNETEATVATLKDIRNNQ
tara:strand:- start:343 stop:777 length:435 start_codon:yes stop_codon:yes gene_type:complete